MIWCVNFAIRFTDHGYPVVIARIPNDRRAPWLPAGDRNERRSLISETYEIKAIGRIRNRDGKAWIEIDPAYQEAILGLESFSHVMVLYWFHENDTPENRKVLQVHPCKNPENPLTGVFATHSPLRPNLIALTRCRILEVADLVVRIDKIDAVDNSPLIDMKCYIPEDDSDVKIPEWVGRRRSDGTKRRKRNTSKS